jgi:hypothetical protein
MAQTGERYRKLPGHRRGLIQGSSVWMAADHLLLVKSTRFREEYKRFHLRDIQAIVVARAGRYHVSTRAITLAALWLVAFLFAWRPAPWARVPLGAAAAFSILAWLYVSSARSCRCVIFTAVSRDYLPSVYRTWTARKFLDQVSPPIWKVQGVVEGDWAEAIETRTLGPGRAGLEPADSLGAGPAARARTVASDLFLAATFLSAIVKLITFRHFAALQSIWYVLDCAQLAGAVFVFFHYHRRLLRAGMQGLAIACLVLIGTAHYVRQMMESVNPKSQAPPAMLLTEAGALLLLALIGAGMILTSRRK